MTKKPKPKQKKTGKRPIPVPPQSSKKGYGIAKEKANSEKHL